MIIFKIGTLCFQKKKIYLRTIPFLLFNYVLRRVLTHRHRVLRVSVLEHSKVSTCSDSFWVRWNASSIFFKFWRKRKKGSRFEWKEIHCRLCRSDANTGDFVEKKTIHGIWTCIHCEIQWSKPIWRLIVLAVKDTITTEGLLIFNIIIGQTSFSVRNVYRLFSIVTFEGRRNV